MKILVQLPLRHYWVYNCEFCGYNHTTSYRQYFLSDMKCPSCGRSSDSELVSDTQKKYLDKNLNPKRKVSGADCPRCGAQMDVDVDDKAVVLSCHICTFHKVYASSELVSKPETEIKTGDIVYIKGYKRKFTVIGVRTSTVKVESDGIRFRIEKSMVDYASSELVSKPEPKFKVRDTVNYHGHPYRISCVSYEGWVYDIISCDIDLEDIEGVYESELVSNFFT